VELIERFERKNFIRHLDLIRHLDDHDPSAADLLAHFDATEAALRDLRAENEKLAGLLKEAKDAILWCGGSDDFAPTGKAGVGWRHPYGPLAVIARIDAALAERRKK
jgi:hypothetical protein